MSYGTLCLLRSLRHLKHQNMSTGDDFSFFSSIFGHSMAGAPPADGFRLFFRVGLYRTIFLFRQKLNFEILEKIG